MESGRAENTRFGRRVVHGMLVASYVSTLVGMRLPGTGALLNAAKLPAAKAGVSGRHRRDRARSRAEILGARLLVIRISATNQDGIEVMDGEGAVHVPVHKTLWSTATNSAGRSKTTSPQFNVMTQRYGEQQIAGLAETPGCDVYTVRVKDRFGDNGWWA